MGYDMSMRKTPPPAPEHDIEQARELYEAANKALDQARQRGLFANDRDRFCVEIGKVDALWVRYLQIKHPEDFRLNNYGMSTYCNAMLELGMMHHSTTPKIDWDSMPMDYDTAEEEAAYYEISDRLTGQHGDNPAPTIPSHKFSGNDGWFITPAEIRAALDAWESFEAGTPNGFSADTLEVVQTDYWGKWIDYLRLAVDHDGFRVH